MFDIGWTEIVVVVIVSCLTLDIKDLIKIIKASKQITHQINIFIKDMKLFFHSLEKEAETTTKKITDLEGNEQIAYDIEEIMPDIKKSKNPEKK